MQLQESPGRLEKGASLQYLERTQMKPCKVIWVVIIVDINMLLRYMLKYNYSLDLSPYSSTKGVGFVLFLSVCPPI